MSEVKNVKLRDTLLGLSTAFNSITKTLDMSNHRIEIGLFHDVNSPVFKLKEYVNALQIMAGDSVIESHADKLIGSAGSQRRISRPEFLQAFLKWNRQINIDSDEVSFLQCYHSFEKFFYSPNITSFHLCKLFNFVSDVDEIKFSDSLKIRKLNQIEMARREESAASSFDLHFENMFKSDYLIEMKSEVKKLIKSGDESTEDDRKEIDNLSKHSKTIESSLDSVIKALRLLKPSSVYRDHAIEQRYEGYFGCFGSRSSIPFFENTVLGAKCVLNKEEVEVLKKLWQQIEVLKTNRTLGIAIDRLSYVTERRNVTDRILDNFIGLESLYLPGGNHELTFRLSLRVAMMTQEESDKMKDTFSFVKKMYEARSKIVHGDAVSVATAELERLEKLLRDSIKLFLEDKTKFEGEGLNDIFFKRPLS